MINGIEKIYPQILMGIWSLYAFSKHIIFHGEYKQQSQLKTPALVFIYISIGIIEVFLLYKGGFNFFSWPGVVIGLLLLISPAVLIRAHIKNEWIQYHAGSMFFTTLLIQALYYFGGFYDIFKGL